MAKVFPDGWRELAMTSAAERELQTLALLADGLSDEYSVYHGVHWTRIENNNFAIYGEIDFAIVGPTGKVLLIEQKAGSLNETADGLSKKYSDKEKNVRVQMARNADGLHSRLRKFCKGEQTFVDSLLYCPDYTVKQPGTAGIAPERIIDARKKDRLIEIIRSILPETGDALASKPKIHRFLGEILELVPEVHAIVGETGALYTRLSGGLSSWARKIDCQPFRLRVVGTAGSGKTQLAMAVFRDAIDNGRRPLYVCYNRPLADHIALIVPTGGEVATYHQLGDRIGNTLGQPTDFRKPAPFSSIEQVLASYTPPDADLFDELIVDEGQDFQQDWAENLLRFLRPRGRAWWLEDPMQNLYGRPAMQLPGWVSLRSDTNYRSPKDILEALNRILPLERPIEPGSPISGSDVEILIYSNTEELIAKTIDAITHAVDIGFKRSHVALVSYRGRESSKLTPFDRLGPHTLRAPTGQYDLLGNPIYTEGDVLIDSVHRYKGRAAPCVIFTEIDFSSLDEDVIRRIFVGATRATMKLTLIVSEISAKILLGRQ